MVTLCAVMLGCVVGFMMCALLHDRFGKTAERLILRLGITLIFLFVVAGASLLLNLINQIL